MGGCGEGEGKMKDGGWGLCGRKVGWMKMRGCGGFYVVVVVFFFLQIGITAMLSDSKYQYV